MSNYNNFDKGYQLFKLGRSKAAIKTLQEGLIAFPNDGLTYSLIGIIYMSNGDIDRALEFVDKGLEVAPSESFSYYAKGIVIARKAAIKAIPYIKKAIEINPQLGAYHIELAKIYILLQQTTKAREHIDMALQLKAANEEALALKSKLAFLDWNMEEAEQLIDKALQIDPTNFALLQEKAIQAEYKGDYHTASLLYEQMIFARPEDWVIRDSFLDARLGIHPLYRYLVRPFFYVSRPAFLFSCLTDCVFIMVIVLVVVNFGPVLIEVISLLLSTFIIFRLIKWLTRLIGHNVLSRKLWKLKRRDYVNLPNFISLSIILMLINFLLYVNFLNDITFIITLTIAILLLFFNFTYEH